MKKLIYITFLLLASITINAQYAGDNLNMDDFNKTNPPPPTFGGDGPGAPYDAPPSPIDAYTLYLIVIGGVLILLFKNKIFKVHQMKKERIESELLE